MLENENIICISDINWDAHQVCEQHLMRVFSKHNKVFYIDRPVSFFSPFTAFGPITTLKQLKRWIKGGVRHDDGMNIATPPPFLPLRFNALTNVINQTVMIKWIRNLIEKNDLAAPIIISFEPDSGLLPRRLKEKLFIYYCNDDHQSKNKWWNSKKSIIDKERELLQRSDLVLALTEGFAATREKFNKNTYILPNAVDEQFISFSKSKIHETPNDMTRIKRPIIGYFGILDSRLDLKLLARIAQTRGRWSLVLVGPLFDKMTRDFFELCNLSNVYYLGEKKKGEFSSYIGAMDVCVIPAIVSDRTRNVLSLKLFEYSALGKPIVSTDLPELRRYSEYVYVSRDHDDFIDNITIGLREDDDKKIEKRMQFASQNTWKHRAEQLSKIIVNHTKRENDLKELM